MSWSAKVWLAVAAATGGLLWLLGPVLAPFVASAGLAYLGDPLVDRLERLRMSRTGAVTIVFTALSALVLIVLILLVPRLLNQVATFVGNIPEYLNWIQDVGLPAIGVTVPTDQRLDATALREMIAENWQQAGGLAKTALGALTRSGIALLAFFALALLVPVVTFYLLRDWDRLVHWIDGVLPLRQRDTIRALARESDEVLSGFLRGQLLVMIALAVVYSAGLAVVGVDLALLIGVGAGLVSFVPYLGFIVGLLAASVAVLVQTQELLPLAFVLAVFMLGQVLESMVLTPQLVGDRIGLHPVAVIFAVMAGGQLFGFAGVLLALPVAAVLAVLLRHAHARWLGSQLYRGDPP